MNFFHCPIKIVSRNKGRSAVASAAYISGTRLENTWDGTTHDYTRKQHIIHSEIMLPVNAPPQYMDRATLWNSVEWNETDRNAQLARVFEIALPAELTHEQNITLARKIVQDLFVSKGMCADFGVHDKKDGNPHVHGRSCRSRSVPPLKSSMRLNCASIARQRKHYSDGRTAVKPLTTRAGRKRSSI